MFNKKRFFLKTPCMFLIISLFTAIAINATEESALHIDPEILCAKKQAEDNTVITYCRLTEALTKTYLRLITREIRHRLESATQQYITENTAKILITAFLSANKSVEPETSNNNDDLLNKFIVDPSLKKYVQGKMKPLENTCYIRATILIYQFIKKTFSPQDIREAVQEASQKNSLPSFMKNIFTEEKITSDTIKQVLEINNPPRSAQPPRRTSITREPHEQQAIILYTTSIAMLQRALPELLQSERYSEIRAMVKIPLC